MNALNHLFNNLPLVTEFPSRKQWESAAWEILMARVAKIQSADDLKKILQFLISSRERRLMTLRALCASRINSGIGPSEIQRELWITRVTASTIKKSLHEGEYKSAHARGHKPKEYTPRSKESNFAHRRRRHGWQPFRLPSS